MLLLLVFVIALVSLTKKADAIKVAGQFLYDDNTNPQCSGNAIMEFPITLADICLDSELGPTGSSMIFDCSSKAQKSYEGKGCKEGSINSVQSGCSPAGPGTSYNLDCLDVPANQLLVVESGRFCEGNELRNRTQVGVIQLDKCFVSPPVSFKAYQSGETYRTEIYNNTECRNDPDTVVGDIYINNRCTSELRLDGTTSVAHLVQRADASSILGNSGRKPMSISVFVTGGVLLVSTLLNFARL